MHTRSVRAIRPIFFSLALAILLYRSPHAAAKTYIITNGHRSIACTSFSADSVGLPVTAPVPLHRSRQVILNFRGEIMQLFSSEETVGALLDGLGLTISTHDTLSHPLDTPLSDGMELTVTSVITQQETYTITIPHETTFCTDTSLPEGTEEVLVRGRDGELLCTADVTYVNGQETSRQCISQRQSIAPVTEIIARGSGRPVPAEAQTMPIIQDGYIIMPSGEILTYYKTDNVTATGYTHTDAGCDLITSTGTTVHYGTVAVDPRFIPYGTRMLIVSHDGERYYGIATAEDCGGAIKRDRMDLYFPTYQECIEFGRRRCTIYFLG